MRSGETTTSFCLGYMDDLAVVLDDPSEILQSIVSRAQSLGFTFNPDKCGAANIPSTLSIGVVPVPVVAEERAYNYIGTTTFPGMMGGLEACFERAWNLAELVEDSHLSPMQKLHALRTKTIPMLYHLLENSYTTQSQLQRMNRAIRKMTKCILCLPEKATTAYVNLNRMYGGPGIPDLVLTKAKMTIKSFVNAYNIKDALGTLTRRLLLRDSTTNQVIHAINQKNRTDYRRLQRKLQRP